MGRGTFTIKAEWDDEAGVWYVSESDVPGLAAEAGTVEALWDKLKLLVPDLIVLNRHLIGVDIDPCLPIHLMAERTDRPSGRC